MSRLKRRTSGPLNEAAQFSLIAVELVSGFLAALLLLGLVPGDGVNFNVLGSLVLSVPCAAVFIAANWYRRRSA